MMIDQSEGEGRIEQRHVDATRVGAIGEHIFVAGIAEQRTAREVEEHRVILNFTERHQVGQLPGLGVGALGRRQLTAGQNHLSNVVQLAPIARAAPAVGPIGQPLHIVLQRVVAAIEEVLAVERHHREETREQQTQHGSVVRSYSRAESRNRRPSG